MHAVYVGGLLVVSAWLIWDRRDEVRELTANARPLLLGAALVVGFVQLALNAAFWRAALAASGERVPFARVLRAGMVSLPGRYLPGSVWYAVGRGALLRRGGVPLRAVGTAAVLETGLSITVGVSLGSLLLVSSTDASGRPLLLAVVAVAAGAACSPPSVNLLLAVVARRRGGTAARLSWRAFATLIAWTAVFWVGAATMFSLYLHAFPGIELDSIAEVAGSFMIAWVLGFLAVFAPQGIGVFEVTVATLVTSEPAAGVALVVAGYRLLTLVRDVVAVLAATLTRSDGEEQELSARRERPLAAPAPGDGHRGGT